MGFVQSMSDPCIYTAESKSDGLFILAVYVDDVLVAGKSEQKFERVKVDLGERFKLKDLGELHYFLGVSVRQSAVKTWIGQPGFTQAIIEKFGMGECRPVNTPVAAGTKLLKATEESEGVDATLYQSAVGSLLYLSGWTRPNVAFAVGQVARFCSNPTTEHWTAVKRILRYLKGTAPYGLMFAASGDTGGGLIGYSDADWAGDVNDRKSTSGYLFMMNGAAVSWRSQKQTCVALSTAEAEYIALAAATQEATWMRKLMNDFHESQAEPVTIYEDNQSAICIAKNPQSHHKTKHVDIKYHYVRDKVQDVTIKIQYCPTNDMIADILTKGLTHD